MVVHGLGIRNGLGKHVIDSSKDSSCVMNLDWAPSPPPSRSPWRERRGPRPPRQLQWPALQLQGLAVVLPVLAPRHRRAQRRGSLRCLFEREVLAHLLGAHCRQGRCCRAHQASQSPTLGSESAKSGVSALDWRRGDTTLFTFAILRCAFCSRVLSMFSCTLRFLAIRARSASCFFLNSRSSSSTSWMPKSTPVNASSANTLHEPRVAA